MYPLPLIRSMGNNSDSENSDEDGLEAAKEEIDEEPESGLGPAADGEKEKEETNLDPNDTTGN